MSPLFSGIRSESVLYKLRLVASKPQTLLRSLLLIPYLAWGIGLLIVYLGTELAGNSNTPNTFLDIFTGVVGVYTIGIVVWGIPYTVLVVGLFVWSLNKPAPTIFKVFIFSPFLLSILASIEVALITFLPPQALTLEDLMDFLAYTLITVIPILGFGYGFVGLGSIIYKAARNLNLIGTEGEAK